MTATAIGKFAPGTQLLALVGDETLVSKHGHHVTLRLVEEGFIATGAAELRALSRVVYACGNQRGLLAFRVTENHLHVLLSCRREDAGGFARVTLPALRRVLLLETPFEAARIRPITDSRHLWNTLAYVFEQGRRHQSSFDRAHDGSSLVDLLGLRRMDAAPTLRRVRETFPRLRRGQLIEWLGVPGVGLSDASLRGAGANGGGNGARTRLSGAGRELPGVDLARDLAPELVLLAESAAAAVGRSLEDLRGRTHVVRAAKRAAILVGRRWWSDAELRRSLDSSARAFRLLAAQPIDEDSGHARLLRAGAVALQPGYSPASALEHAVLGQLLLRSHLARREHSIGLLPGDAWNTP